MSTKPKDVWMTTLMSRCRSADEGVLLLELENAMREFFESSMAWQDELGPYTISAGTDLELDKISSLTEDGLSVVYVREVRVGDYYAIEIPKDPGMVDTISDAEPILYYYCPVPNVIHFEPPNAVDVLGITYVRAALRPKTCNSIIPDFVGTHLFEPILDGTLGRLFGYTDVPFSNEAKSQYHLRRFRNGIGKWRDQAERKFTKADRTWLYPRGWV